MKYLKCIVGAYRAGVWTCLGFHIFLQTKEQSSFLKRENGAHTQSFACHLLYFSVPTAGLYWPGMLRKGGKSLLRLGVLLTGRELAHLALGNSMFDAATYGSLKEDT